MTADEIASLLAHFRWNCLSRMFGCVHNSIIGFLSTEWTNRSGDHFVLDGAPSPSVGQGRRGQKNADVVLCRGQEPQVVAEVETDIAKYCSKLDSVRKYLKNHKDFEGLAFGLLVLTNVYHAPRGRKYQHNWDGVKEEVREKKAPLALVSIKRQKEQLDNSPLGRLRGSRSDYYRWRISQIDYWIRATTHDIREGTLWKEEGGG